MPNSDTTPDPVELDKQSLESGYLPGPPSVLTCPECGGVLWESRQGGLVRFQCHIKHTFSVEDLLESQAEEIEQRLWSLLRFLKERINTVRQIAAEVSERDSSSSSVQRLQAQAQQALQQAELIRQALLIDKNGSSEASKVDESSHEDES